MTLHRRQQGLTLIEIMISLVIALLITIIVSYVFLGTRRSYSSQDDNALLQENARFGMDIASRMIRQAGYEYSYVNATNDVSRDRCRSVAARMVTGGELLPQVDFGPRLFGQGNVGPAASDRLDVRFCGSGRAPAPTPADNQIVDCDGNGVPGNVVGQASLRVADLDGTGGLPRLIDTSGQPQRALVCVNAAGTAQPLIVGVETMQLAYGLDTNGDDAVDQWTVAGLMTGVTPFLWENVRAVRISLLLRGNSFSLTSATPASASFTHFAGETYSQVTAIAAGSEQLRPRRLYEMTVALRNAVNSL